MKRVVTITIRGEFDPSEENLDESGFGPEEFAEELKNQAEAGVRYYEDFLDNVTVETSTEIR
jgi:hypothetical protein